MINDDAMSPTMDIETRYCAHTYHPLPVVLALSTGVFVCDEVACAEGPIGRAGGRIQQVPGDMKPRRLAS